MTPWILLRGLTREARHWFVWSPVGSPGGRVVFGAVAALSAGECWCTAQRELAPGLETMGREG